MSHDHTINSLRMAAMQVTYEPCKTAGHVIEGDVGEKKSLLRGVCADPNNLKSAKMQTGENILGKITYSQNAGELNAMDKKKNGWNDVSLEENAKMVGLLQNAAERIKAGWRSLCDGGR